MKKRIGIIIAAMTLLVITAGCTQNQQADSPEQQAEEMLSVNDAFDNEQMVSLDGTAFRPSDYNGFYTAEKLGFGITFTDTMVDLLSKGKLAINEYGDWITLSYVTEEAMGLVENADFDNLSEEETLKVFEAYSEKNYQVAGVYRHNQKDPVSKREQEQFADTFSQVEELIALDGNAYYLGYNTDAASFSLEEEEKKTLDTLLEEMETFRGGIAIFPMQEENVFEGNMKEFSTTTLTGEAVTQDIFQEYDLTMVNIWATWCGPCITEMPELQKLYGMLPENVNMITVCADGTEDMETAKEVIASVQGEFPVLLLDEKLQESLMSSIQYFPTTIFVDKEGNPVGEGIYGVPSYEKVAEAYLSAIEQRLEE